MKHNIKKIYVGLPEYIVEKLDKYSKEIGITRNVLIKMWLCNCVMKTEYEYDPLKVVSYIGDRKEDL